MMTSLVDICFKFADPQRAHDEDAAIYDLLLLWCVMYSMPQLKQHKFMVGNTVLPALHLHVSRGLAVHAASDLAVQTCEPLAHI